MGAWASRRETWRRLRRSSLRGGGRSPAQTTRGVAAQVPQTQMGAGVATSPHSSFRWRRRGGAVFRTGSGRDLSASVGSVAFPFARRRPVPLCGSLARRLRFRHASSARRLRSRAGNLRKVGSARVRLSPFAHFALLPQTPLPVAFVAASVLANLRRFLRGGSGWLLASRFRFAAFPATQTSWQPPPSRARQFRLWINRITGIRFGGATKPCAIRVLHAGNPSRCPLSRLPRACKKLWRSVTFLLPIAQRSGGTM